MKRKLKRITQNQRAFSDFHPLNEQNSPATQLYFKLFTRLQNFPYTTNKLRKPNPSLQYHSTVSLKTPHNPQPWSPPWLCSSLFSLSVSPPPSSSPWRPHHHHRSHCHRLQVAPTSLFCSRHACPMSRLRQTTSPTLPPTAAVMPSPRL